jgi:hypothetical protein
MVMRNRCLVRAANLLAENELLVRINAIRHGIADVFATAAKSHGQAYSALPVAQLAKPHFEQTFAQPFSRTFSTLNI